MVSLYSNRTVTKTDLLWCVVTLLHNYWDLQRTVLGTTETSTVPGKGLYCWLCSTRWRASSAQQSCFDAQLLINGTGMHTMLILSKHTFSFENWGKTKIVYFKLKKKNSKTSSCFGYKIKLENCDAHWSTFTKGEINFLSLLVWHYYTTSWARIVAISLCF